MPASITVLRATRFAWRKFSDFLWVAFYSVARFRFGGKPEFCRDPLYARNRFLIGKISEAARLEASRIFTDAPKIQYRKEDFPQGYRWSYNFDEKKFNAASLCYDLSGAWQKSAVARVVSDFSDLMNRVYGSPWRIVNVRAYSTLGRETAVFEGGPNTWHSDKFNSAILKALVYLTPINAQAGATEVRLPDDSTMVTEGEAGTFLIFDPTKVIHRGLPPVTGRRDTVEITFAAAQSLEKGPVMAGQNAVYPWFPWGRAQPA